MFAKLSENGSIVYPPHNSGNLMNCHLNRQWLAANGFEDHNAEWFTAHAPAAPAVVHRYSTLKLHDAIGHDAWQRIVESLDDAQRTRLLLAQELSTEDTQFAAALQTLRAAFPDADEILTAAEVI